MANLIYTSPVPVGTRIGSNFGPRAGGNHAGDDYPPKESGTVGLPITAIADGEVIAVGTNILAGHSGKAVYVKHSDGHYSYYGHLNSILVKKGDRVKRGQVIGAMGWTGNVQPKNKYGTHLHLGIKVNNKWVDPSVFLANKGIRVGVTKPAKTTPAPKPPVGNSSVKTYQVRQNRYGSAGLYPDGIKGKVTDNWKAWVKLAQRALDNYNGVRGKVVDDGDYGPKFRAQVLTVQKRNGLHPDGVLGNFMAAWMRRQGSNLRNRPSNRP